MIRSFLSLLMLGSVLNAQNAIVLENQKPGDRNYFWTGHISDDLAAFSDPFAIVNGDTINFKINTVHGCSIDIYRVGYYNGAGGRKITTISVPATLQPAFRTDLSTGLVDAGNWSANASWTSGGAPSGVYLASCKDNAGNQFVIPFVVTDNSYHDILLQTSDTTWAAYTGWGGYNMYGKSSSSYPDLQGVHHQGQAFKVSYNRPFSVAYGWGYAAGPQDSFFNAEAPAVHWLEKMGYDVKYQGAVQTDAIGIHNCRVFVSCGHDEYWTEQQRANAFSALYSGVNLCFWSGNTCYWRCRWESDSNGEPWRVLVCYKDTWQNAASDPVSPTLQWRDSRFGNTDYPENSLMGQMSISDGVYSPNTDIQVPSDPTGWFWAGVRLPITLHGLLGYESDAPVDNGYQPAGLQFLSSTTYNNTENLSLKIDSSQPWPGNPPLNPITHHLTLYRSSAGTLVFAAGTVFWSWGLDGDHDFSMGSTTGQPDPNVQTAMVNLLSQMGVNHP